MTTRGSVVNSASRMASWKELMPPQRPSSALSAPLWSAHASKKLIECAKKKIEKRSPSQSALFLGSQLSEAVTSAREEKGSRDEKAEEKARRKKRDLAKWEVIFSRKAER